MNITYYIPLLLLFLFCFMEEQKKKKILKHIKKRRTEDQREMVELAKRFLEKECVVDTIEHQVLGTVIEVLDGAILLKTDSGEQALNLDFVERIREYPKNKKGKKKPVVLD